MFSSVFKLLQMCFWDKKLLGAKNFRCKLAAKVWFINSIALLNLYIDCYSINTYHRYIQPDALHFTPLCNQKPSHKYQPRNSKQISCFLNIKITTTKTKTKSKKKNNNPKMKCKFKKFNEIMSNFEIFSNLKKNF